MSDTVYTSAGTKLSVSTDLPETNDQAGYEAVGVVFSECGEITNIEAFGRTYEQVPHQPLGSRGTKIRKGSYEEGQPTLTMARLPGTDAGQTILRTESKTDNQVSVKIEYANGDITYAQALVMSYEANIGSINQITQASSQLAFQPDTIVEVDAS